MKYNISGFIKRGHAAFSMEISAENEAHAKGIALIKLGSKQGLKKSEIEISNIKKLE